MKTLYVARLSPPNGEELHYEMNGVTSVEVIAITGAKS